MSTYFVNRGGKQVGPLTIEQIISKDLKPDDFVWRQGLSEWLRADQIEEFKQLFPTTTIQPPPFNNISHASDLELQRLKVEQEKEKTKNDTNQALIALLIIIIIAIAGYFIYREYNDSKLKEENPFYQMREW